MIASTDAPVPPIATHALLLFLLQVGLLLLLATSLGKLATRCGLPAVVGELLVGVLLGPTFLLQVAPDVSTWLFPPDPEQVHLLDGVGQIGVLLLVGLTGMQMDLGLVRRRAVSAAGTSIGGLVVPLGLGIGVAFLLPGSVIPPDADRTVFALFLGVAMCVSAIPVIAKTLIDMNLLHRNVGQLTLIAGMVEDIIGWVLLSVVAAMAANTVSVGIVLSSIAYLIAILVFAFTIGRVAVRRLVLPRGTRGTRVPLTAVIVILILLSSAGTQALGLEAVFGAFMCGIMIRTAGRIPPESLAPLRTVVLSVLAPIFFATAGLRMDLTVLLRPEILLTGLAVLAVAILGKFAGAYAGARLTGLGRWESLALGAGLNARGVIEVIVAMVGLRLGIISVEVYTIVVLVAIVTSLLAPPILRVTMRRVEQTSEEKLRELDMNGSSTVDTTTDTSRNS